MSARLSPDARTRVSLLIGIAALCACQPEQQSSQIPEGSPAQQGILSTGSIRTVPYFLDNPEELAKVLQRCGVDPGRSATDHSCINAAKARKQRLSAEIDAALQ